MSDELEGLVSVGETEVDLSTLAGIELDDVAEVRSFDFPKGVYVWNISSDPAPKIATREVNDPDNVGKKISKAVVVFALECTDVIKYTPEPDSKITEEDLIGKKHYEQFWLGNEDGIGRLKAFLVDSGVQASGPLIEVIQGTAGHAFQAPIKHARSKNDSDRVYVNLDLNKVETIG